MTPALPTIYGPADYRDFRDTLEHIDGILTVGEIESLFVRDDLKRRGISSPSEKDISIRRKMLRCNILGSITGLDFRECAMRLADSTLFQWFRAAASYALPGELSTRNQLAVHSHESGQTQTGCAEAAKEDSAQDEEAGKTGGGTWSAIP